MFKLWLWDPSNAVDWYVSVYNNFYSLFKKNLKKCMELYAPLFSLIEIWWILNIVPFWVSLVMKRRPHCSALACPWEVPILTLPLACKSGASGRGKGCAAGSCECVFPRSRSYVYIGWGGKPRPRSRYTVPDADDLAVFWEVVKGSFLVLRDLDSVTVDVGLKNPHFHKHTSDSEYGINQPHSKKHRHDNSILLATRPL